MTFARTHRRIRRRISLTTAFRDLPPYEAELPLCFNGFVTDDDMMFLYCNPNEVMEDIFYKRPYFIYNAYTKEKVDIK